MKKVYLVKGKLDEHEEILCAIFSELDLANTYVSKSKEENKTAVYRVETWTMDYHA